MLAFAPDYDHYPLIAKVEAFEHALQSMEGNDLAKVCSLFSELKGSCFVFCYMLNIFPKTLEALAFVYDCLDFVFISLCPLIILFL